MVLEHYCHLLSWTYSTSSSTFILRFPNWSHYCIVFVLYEIWDNVEILSQLFHFKCHIHVCFGRVESCFDDRGSDMQSSGTCGKTQEASVSDFGILL